jgi:hypothetical protein
LLTVGSWNGWKSRLRSTLVFFQALLIKSFNGFDLNHRFQFVNALVYLSVVQMASGMPEGEEEEDLLLLKSCRCFLFDGCVLTVFTSCLLFRGRSSNIIVL